MDLNSQGEQQQAEGPDSALPEPPEPQDSGAAIDNGRQEAADILRGNQPAESGQLSGPKGRLALISTIPPSGRRSSIRTYR